MQCRKPLKINGIKENTTLLHYQEVKYPFTSEDEGRIVGC